MQVASLLLHFSVTTRKEPRDESLRKIQGRLALQRFPEALRHGCAPGSLEANARASNADGRPEGAPAIVQANDAGVVPRRRMVRGLRQSMSNLRAFRRRHADDPAP